MFENEIKYSGATSTFGARNFIFRGWGGEYKGLAPPDEIYFKPLKFQHFLMVEGLAL